MTHRLLPLALLAATACGGGGDADAARCEQARTAAEQQATAATTAATRASEAEAAKTRAQSAFLRASTAGGFQGLDVPLDPALQAAERTAAAERSRATQEAEEAEADKQRQGRLLAQLLVGDPSCFPPADVAAARDALAQ